MNVPRWVVVDDTNPDVQYIEASWFQDQGSKDLIGDYGPAYQSTLHGTNTSASFSFPFNGTQVKVLGFNNIRNDSNVLDPTWDCFVDNAAIGKTIPTTNQRNSWVFCQHDELYDGPHVLTVNTTVAKGQTFWFDQIQYVPSSSDLFAANATFLLDNADQTLINGLGFGWGPFGETTNGTIIDNAYFSFTFVGTSLSWYGITPVDFPRSAATGYYQVDYNKSVAFTFSGLPSGANTTLYNQKLFETPQYSYGRHQIYVYHRGNSSTTPLTLDYLLVQNATNSLSVSPPPEIASTQENFSTTDSSDSNNIGEIIGLTIGMLAMILLAVYVYCYYRLVRNKRQKKLKPDLFDLYDGYVVEPVYLEATLPPEPTGPAHSQTQFLPHSPQARRAGKTNILHRPAQHDRDTTEHVPLIPSNPSSDPEPPLPPSLVNKGTSSRLIVHEDSGVRLRPVSVPESLGEASILSEVPPMYTTG